MSLLLPCTVLVVGMMGFATSVPAPLSGAPVAVDDFYTTTQDKDLSVDDPGVLENDWDPDQDPLTAILVDSTGAIGQLLLSPDGSFEYKVAPGFVGVDQFTYKANDGSQDSNTAVVTVSVMPSTGGGRTAYTDETAFLGALAAMGSSTRLESFEDDALWGSARWPNTDGSVTSQGIAWTSNNGTSQLSTSSGAALDGMWGVFSYPHGNYTSGSQCNLPGVCTDGWMGKSAWPLAAVGGWVRTAGMFGGLNIILDGDTANPVDFNGVTLTSGWKFFGVIDTAGFTTFEYRETEGTAGDQVFLFGDRFSFARNGAPARRAGVRLPKGN